MAIEKKLIHFGKLTDFETQLNAGNILNRSIVFIQDAKKIWTHGTYYDCSEGADLSAYLTADEIAEVYATIEQLSGKQDTLVSGTNIKTINGTSILGSGNIVIEGGSGSSSSGGSSAYSEVSHGTSDTTFTLTPNTFHVWDEVSTLDLTFGDETSGVANEFLFQFTSGSTATTLTLPDDIKWANDTAPTIAENMIYQISVLKGLASCLEFKNTAIITFTIGDIEYQAEEGMVWGAWCISTYNTNEFYVEGNWIWKESRYYVRLSGSPVSPTDSIIEGTNYELKDDMD